MFGRQNSIKEQYRCQIESVDGLLAFQPSQPLFRILQLRNTRVSVFPEGEDYANHSLGNIISCPNCVETSQSWQRAC